MIIDIVKPEPRTQYEAWERRMNNMTAQWIGLSVFSKTIEVSEKNENDWEFELIEAVEDWKMAVF